MNDVKKFHPFDASVDGLLKLNDSMWMLTKPSKVRDCNLDIGTLIVKPDITDYSNMDDLLVIDSIPSDQKDLEFKGKVLAPKKLGSKYVDAFCEFERHYPYDETVSIWCDYQIAAYDDTLPSGVGVSPFNVVLSSDFFVDDIIHHAWTDDGKIVCKDTIAEFVVEDVDINHDYTFVGKAALKDGSIKHNVNIEFDDDLSYMYPFVLELTQFSLVARHIKNNGYDVDFNKLSYDLGIRPKLIEATASQFNHFYSGEEQQPVNLTYFGKGGRYLGGTQSEIDILPSVSEVKSIDNGIDR